MKSKIRIVFLKELREMLRERRTLMFLLAASLMYPAIIGLLLNQMIERNTRSSFKNTIRILDFMRYLLRCRP
ncbi:MAG: hypothetical protein EOO78_31540, partial [Oxalobacteraceae bacterium]